MDGKHKVCILQYRKGKQPNVTYVLYADDDSEQITTLLYFAGFEHHSNREDAVSVSSKSAEELDAILIRLPEPLPSYTDWSPLGSPLTRDNYRLKLSGKYGDKYYAYGWSNLSFEMSRSDFDLWLSLVEKLLQMLEDLTGNKNQLRPDIEDIIEVYKKAFHKKGRYSKYQKRWTEPKYISEYEYYYTHYRPFFDQFIDENIATDHLRQLDFCHYLPAFLWLITFQKTVRWRKGKKVVIDTMTVFQRLSETDIFSWDQDAQDALHEYFTALWNYVLTYYPPLGMDAYTFVHGVQLTGLDVTDYIKHWKSSIDDISASRHLAGYVQSLYEHYIEDGADVFDTVPTILRRWLRDVGEGDYFLKRYMAYDGVRAFADEFAEASEALTMLREAGL